MFPYKGGCYSNMCVPCQSLTSALPPCLVHISLGPQHPLQVCDSWFNVDCSTEKIEKDADMLQLLDEERNFISLG